MPILDKDSEMVKKYKYLASNSRELGISLLETISGRTGMKIYTISSVLSGRQYCGQKKLILLDSVLDEILSELGIDKNNAIALGANCVVSEEAEEDPYMIASKIETMVSKLISCGGLSLLEAALDRALDQDSFDKVMEFIEWRSNRNID